MRAAINTSPRRSDTARDDNCVHRRTLPSAPTSLCFTKWTLSSRVKEKINGFSWAIRTSMAPPIFPLFSGRLSLSWHGLPRETANTRLVFLFTSHRRMELTQFTGDRTTAVGCKYANLQHHVLAPGFDPAHLSTAVHFTYLIAREWPGSHKTLAGFVRRLLQTQR